MKIENDIFLPGQIYPYPCQTCQDISLKAVLSEKGLIDVITRVRQEREIEESSETLERSKQWALTLHELKHHTQEA